MDKITRGIKPKIGLKAVKRTLKTKTSPIIKLLYFLKILFVIPNGKGLKR